MLVTTLLGALLVGACEAPGCQKPTLVARDVDVAVIEDVVLEARMTDDDGDPIEGAIIMFRMIKPPERGGGEHDIQTAVTDENGVARYDMGEAATVIGSFHGALLHATEYKAERRRPEAIDGVPYCFVTSESASIEIERRIPWSD